MDVMVINKYISNAFGKNTALQKEKKGLSLRTH